MTKSTYLMNQKEWTEHKIIVSKYQIIQEVIILKAFLPTISSMMNFFIEQKFCKHDFLVSQKEQIADTHKPST